ncbi:hypothetical protein EJ06DRAFT_395071 [Trichodelitschia bisporula]|uniref:Uncharacterized protein n=1 Tax=Trichodelitschia bisporula TaxID=703511 RepID=A0A6G1I081_9PEZI|nr:hypothetical protein EJ06DRAFT_395071 [Trichodelitschia bisporula]
MRKNGRRVDALSQKPRGPVFVCGVSNKVLGTLQRASMAQGNVSKRGPGAHLQQRQRLHPDAPVFLSDGHLRDGKHVPQRASDAANIFRGRVGRAKRQGAFSWQQVKQACPSSGGLRRFPMSVSSHLSSAHFQHSGEAVKTQNCSDLRLPTPADVRLLDSIYTAPPPLIKWRVVCWMMNWRVA